ncbi:MAG: sigma-54 interaction domain-containing protein [Pyrinomonadaceae bacterium]
MQVQVERDSIDLISQISNLLTETQDLTANFRNALDLLRDNLSLRTVFLLVDVSASDTLAVTAASGLDLGDYRRLNARVGKSVLARVTASSEMLRIHQPSFDESDIAFLFSPGDSLISVPVSSAGLSPGSLSAVFRPDDKRSETLIEKLLRLTASMIGQSLRVESAIGGERRRLIEENSLLKSELKEKYEFSHIVGKSSAIKQVYEQVSQVARSNATVLLRGESGTGKELIASAIHYNSLRSKRPFIRINCAALPDTLIEAELFGHEKGAFTGAERLKKGRFELADGGTLFLDEVGDLPLQTQVKLLRVLQEREFERLGGTGTLKANIRLITATNKNLEDAVAAGEFREDLYYRLNVFTIFLPPLRERKSDILLLAEHFLEKYEIEHEKRVRRISTPAIDMLMAYHYPGNVRELENAIERAVLVCDSNVIHGHHLPPTLQTAEISGTGATLSLATAVERYERDMIQDALKSTSGNVAAAARELDSTERILGYKIKKYQIDTMRFRR